MLQLWIGGAHSQGLLRDVGGDLQEDLQESPRLVVTVDNAGRVVGLDTSRQNVDGESLTSTRKMQTAEKRRTTCVKRCRWSRKRVEEGTTDTSAHQRDGFREIREEQMRRDQ